MIPYIQTDTSKDHGNCWQTAIASILELDPQFVPHFVEHENWWEYTYKWLWYRGYRLEDVHRHLYTNEYYLVTGTTIRKTFHVAVYQNGHMVHDPHPSGAGLLDEYNFIVIR